MIGDEICFTHKENAGRGVRINGDGVPPTLNAKQISFPVKKNLTRFEKVLIFVKEKIGQRLPESPNGSLATLADNPTMDDKEFAPLKSSGWMKQEKRTKIINFS